MLQNQVSEISEIFKIYLSHEGGDDVSVSDVGDLQDARWSVGNDTDGQEARSGTHPFAADVHLHGDILNSGKRMSVEQEKVKEKYKWGENVEEEVGEEKRKQKKKGRLKKRKQKKGKKRRGSRRRGRKGRRKRRGRRRRKSGG